MAWLGVEYPFHYLSEKFNKTLNKVLLYLREVDAVN